MAVIQISRIQVRRGVADSPTPSGLPQLASGEIGWAIDTQRLWIGSGSVDEGAPAVENVEILTKAGFNQLINSFTASNYTYRLENLNSDDSYQPVGAGGRTIQQKLDDTPVSVTDFNVKFSQGYAVPANGTLDSAISVAISSLYYSGGAVPTNSPELNFPAGTYNLSQPIYVPPYARIKGAGKGKTIFVMTSTNTTIIQTVGIDANNLPLTFTNILSGPLQPQDIRISGITFSHTTSTLANKTAQMMLLDGVKNITVEDCEFVGTYNTTSILTSVNSAIEIRNGISTNINIKDCNFTKFAYPIVSNYDVDNILIFRSTFDTNYEGILLGKNISGTNDQTTGPQYVTITNNYFSVSQLSAIDVGSSNSITSYVTSRDNTFDNVGNNGLGDNHAFAPVINFTSAGNQSVDDIFNRLYNLNNSTSPAYGTSQYPLVKGHAKLTTRTPVQVTIPPSGTTKNLLAFPIDTSSYVTAVTDYVVSNSNIIRTGKLYMNVFGSSVSVKDEYNYQGVNDGNVTFSATVTNSKLLLNAINNVSGLTCTAVLSIITLQ